MKRVKISILMPFYNAEKFLDASIQSMLNQTFTDFEFIIINDASTDASDRVIKPYLTDKRIIYIKNSVNKGRTFNLNYGLSIAKGKFIARMDGDDISAPQRLQLQYDFLQSHPDIALVGTFMELIDNSGTPLGVEITKPIGSEKIKEVCFFYGPHAHGTIMVHRDILKKIGNYRDGKNYLNVEDIDLYFRLIYSGFKTDNIPQVLYFYRRHDNNTSNASRITGINSFYLKREIMQKYHLRLDLKNYASIYVHYLLDLALSGHQKSAVEYSLKKLLIRGE